MKLLVTLLNGLNPSYDSDYKTDCDCYFMINSIKKDDTKRAFLLLHSTKECAGAQSLHGVFRLAPLPNNLLFAYNSIN
ncbi:MAG: hypothetical protein ACI8UG_002501 [Gammaproteobacteria bacterium]|jgi:hypothetical protein